MLPRWHVILGIIFGLIVWAVYPNINPIFIGLIIFSSIFIDFDHYMQAVLKTGRAGIFSAFDYHRKKQREEISEQKRGIRKRGDFHIFHTLEFQFFVGLLSIAWVGFFYLFIGMVFHSMLDLASLVYADRIYRREYFLVNWFLLK